MKKIRIQRQTEELRDLEPELEEERKQKQAVVNAKKKLEELSRLVEISPCDEDRQSRLLANQALHSSPILHFLNCPTQEAQQAVIAQVYSNDTQVIFLF